MMGNPDLEQVETIRKNLGYIDSMLEDEIFAIAYGFACAQQFKSKPPVKLLKSKVAYDLLSVKEEYGKVGQINMNWGLRQPILVTSQQLQQVPWDHFREAQMTNTIFNRVLCQGHILDSLKGRIERKQGLYYVLNPGKDLKKSQNKIQPLLEGLGNVRGAVGQKPEQREIIKQLQNGDYFLYVGHGGGELYLPEKTIGGLQGLQGRVYLLGCSSSAMIRIDGIFSDKSNLNQQEVLLEYSDWCGVAVQYLLSGCGMVFGALWPVTDKDADKYAIDLIEQYQNDQCVYPDKVIRNGKSKCNLKQLNGTAFVIYGLNED